jgi:anthranilate phosphoribosyltransferase
VASLELLWTPHQGEHLFISGFVHPPTEVRAWAALALAGENDLLTVKGLEGSTDLPLSRACISGRVRGGEGERLILHPRDHGFTGAEPPWTDLETWSNQALAALGGSGPLAQSLHWNLGSLLWLSGQQSSIEAGLNQANYLLESGAALSKLGKLQKALAA